MCVGMCVYVKNKQEEGLPWLGVDVLGCLDMCCWLGLETHANGLKVLCACKGVLPAMPGRIMETQKKVFWVGKVLAPVHTCMWSQVRPSLATCLGLQL